MPTAMGYFEGLESIATAVQYDGSVYTAYRMQDWIDGDIAPDPEDQLQDNSTELYIYGTIITISATDWLVNTIEGDWYVFGDESWAEMQEWVGEDEAA
jgi:hypothetical protein